MRLLPHLTEVDLKLASYVHHEERLVEWVYFPETSLLSIISGNADGQTVETSMVGNEGSSGLLEACGSRFSGGDCLVQVDGRAWRAPAGACRHLAEMSPDFTAAVLKLAELQLGESRQSTYCQVMHTVERRFARWMGESVERSGCR